MPRPSTRGRAPARAGLALALLAVVAAAGADGGAAPGPDLDTLARVARVVSRRALAWYERTPSADRVAWGGLLACAALGLGTLFERWPRLRPRKIVPREFSARFLARLRDGKLDRGKALDYCELNPSPVARVALGAVRRWDRPVGDQERAVEMAVRAESDRLRRNVGTLRRVAGLAPMVGLLGTLVSSGRALATAGPAWGPALASALGPLTAGVALAILAMVAYDGLVGRVERLADQLQRLGAETVDAIAMATPPEPRNGRTPHSLRIEIPEAHARPGVDRDDYP